MESEVVGSNPSPKVEFSSAFLSWDAHVTPGNVGCNKIIFNHGQRCMCYVGYHLETFLSTPGCNPILNRNLYLNPNPD